MLSQGGRRWQGYGRGLVMRHRSIQACLGAGSGKQVRVGDRPALQWRVKEGGRSFLG